MRRNITTGMTVAVLLLATSSLSVGTPFSELEMGIFSQAMGGTGIVLTGVDALFWNPAAIAGSSEASVGISSRLQYSDMDFTTIGIDGVVPISDLWTAGGTVRYFGGDLYSEQVIALSAAGMLTKDMSFGIQPMYCRAAIEDGVSSYGSAGAIAFNAGFQIRMYSRWMVAACVKNPFQARLGDSSVYLKRKIDTGVGYEPAPGMVTAVTLSRDFRGTRIHVGQSLPLGMISLMGGVQSSPTTVSGGFAMDVSGFDVRYAVQTHPQLSLTHQIGVVYGF